ncbi:MBL fold metallo-hydrolase [Cohnella sp. JJ-181]|uniref:MBL fold metallo-hydrolase n=1 Tax=Cohnella rhizoplanae TaxID=2974897 RepID=UPI0022FF9252|nr:MBL fold metallo-hydrolase [Cohnella sp. JJ-181]CAI6082225.1 hypothetical protein COHCIP112018_03571 [Cohnella sp. JJ-181]
MRDSQPLWTRRMSGIVQLRLPLPFALKWVNAYLLRGEEGWTVVDPGLRTEESEAAWEIVMDELGIGWSDIGRIVLTHYHPDHYGLAGWLQSRTGAEVYLSETAALYAHRLWGEGETFSASLAGAFRAHGLPETLSGGVLAHLESVKRQVLPHPARTRIIRAGDKLSFGGAEWEAVGGEGHAPGHLAFYDRDRRMMLCGDQVLPDITPNIGWMPDGDPDPLGSYLSSLARMAAIEVDTAFPGHREPFAEYGRRVAELRDHHARRLARMAELAEELAIRSADTSDAGDARAVAATVDAASAGAASMDQASVGAASMDQASAGAASMEASVRMNAAGSAGRFQSFAMCETLFGERVLGNPHNLRFAMAETIAHLERMALSGMLIRETEPASAGGQVYYRPTEG